MMRLEDMYPPGTHVYDATINREVLGYAVGTAVRVVLDDPERPGMADVQLPNGRTVRFWRSEVTVVECSCPQGECRGEDREACRIEERRRV